MYEKIKDYTVTTLNPQWGAHFTLTFPCPRTAVQALAADLKAPYDQDGCLTDAAFESIRKALLQWWSQGVVNIEVFDGERFNQEIFMGQFDLLLNGFMVLIKKPDDLEMKGNFQLCKGKPTDRISGSIRVQAYLHPPEKAYIAELLEAGVRASQASVPVFPGKASVLHEDADTASDTDDQEHLRVKAVRGSPEQQQSSHSTSSNNSPPEAAAPQPGSSGVMYSSRFMQTLLRHSKQHGAVFEGNQPPPPPPPPAPVSAPPPPPPALAPEKPTVPARSHFLSRLNSNEDDVEGSERFLRDPHLEESDNIRFSALGGLPVSQLNISESARLLKEKVKQRRSGARKSAAAPAPLASLHESDTDALARSVVIHHDPAPIAQAHGAHHRAQSTSAVTSTAAHLSRVDEHIVPSSRSLKASKEQQSVSASAHRRESMADVSKRLAGLSSLQYSTEAVLDSLHHKLEAKLRLRDSHQESNSPHKTSQQHTPVPRTTPASAASKNHPAYHLEEAEDALEHTMVLELDLEDAEMDDDTDQALNMPNTAEMRRAMLTASFRSSHEEDADAPEMGAESEEEIDFHDAHDSFDEIYDNDEDFGEDEEPFESNHDSYESLDDVAVNGGYEQQYLHQKKAFSAPSDDHFNDSFDPADEVPVVSAQRRHAPPAAQLNRKQPQSAYTDEVYERPDTIYPDEEAEPVRSYSYDDASGYNSDNSNVDETRGAVYNNSTMSSDYSVNVQEFLSPDARHSPRRAALSSAQASHRQHNHDHHDDVNEGEDELIVMEHTPSSRSFDEYGSSPGSARHNAAKVHGLFQVRSREDLLQSSSSVSPSADVRVRDPRKNQTSPSRSLFEASAHDEAPFREQSGPFTPQRRVAAELRGEGSAQRRTPTGVSPSPRREQIRRVVLELDGLDL